MLRTLRTFSFTITPLFPRYILQLNRMASGQRLHWLALVLATDSSKNTAILGADQAIIETTTAGRLSPPVKGFLFEQVKAGIE